MKATIVNLNSAFDWSEDIAVMLEPLDDAGIAAALKLPDEAGAIAERLKELQWVFLVSDLTFKAQVDSNPYGEGQKHENNDEDADLPWKYRVERWRERNRDGRKTNECNPLYRQPRLISGGGVVEALGIYTPDLRAFCSQAPLASPDFSSCGDPLKERLKIAGALDSLLPNEAKGPAVILCPERIFAVPADLASSLDPWEPHPSARLNVSELFLRMTLLHEIGHHLLPAPASENKGDRQAHRIVLSEALANTFCHSLIAPEERRWLFAKARLLQPSAYLAYFVPHLLAALVSESEFAEMWHSVVRQSLLRDMPTICGFANKMPSPLPPLVASEEMYLAINGLFESLGVFRMGHPSHVLHGHKPCAIGVFEEFEMPWDTEVGLRNLLVHGEPSVAAEAFHMLEKRVRRDAESDSALVDWCNVALASNHRQSAQRAWESPLVDREEGRLALK